MKKNEKRRGKHNKQVALSLLTASAALAAGLAVPAHAQNVNCFQSMIFGSIIACSAAGTVRMDPDGTRSTTGCVSVIGPSSHARCILTGSLFPVRPMQISISAPTFTISNGTSHMNVNGFDLNTAGNGPTITLTAFITVVGIGATLHVGANQPSGNYSGTATINVNYQ